MKLQVYNAAFVISVAITSVVTAILVVFKELNPGLKEWMKALTGHHWTTHVSLTVILFVIVGLALALFAPAREGRPGARGTMILILFATAIASAIIGGFYLFHG